LESNGKLYSFDPLTGSYLQLDASVSSYALTPQGRVIDLESNGKLYSFDPLTGSYFQLAGNIVSFALSPDGMTLYTLDKTGTLCRYRGDWTRPEAMVIQLEEVSTTGTFFGSSGTYTVTRPVSAFAIGPDGAVYARTSDQFSRLWKFPTGTPGS